MSNNVTPSAQSTPSAAHFPTSRFPEVPLAHPLSVFGKSFKVELSSGLTLSPDTILRAAIGKSIQTFLREDGKLQPLKQFRDGLLKKHKPSRTTKATIRAAMGPIGERIVAVLDGGDVPQDLVSMSDWSALAMTWGQTSTDNVLDVVVNSFILIDKFVEAVAKCVEANGREAGEQMFQARFGQVMPAWRDLCPGISTEGCLRIESSLYVVAQLEAHHRVPGAERSASLAASFLAPKAKPLGHWLRSVAVAAKCSNNKELADLLVRRNILHQGDRAITHDTLKGWSAMKPGMLMSLEGCQSLLKVVSDANVARQLLARFALARFLAFLCDFLRSSVKSDPPNWFEAQQVLRTRYQQIVTTER